MRSPSNGQIAVAETRRNFDAIDAPRNTPDFDARPPEISCARRSRDRDRADALIGIEPVAIGRAFACALQ
jgi:hypothetical protein